jgi:hypothetical protein
MLLTSLLFCLGVTQSSPVSQSTATEPQAPAVADVRWTFDDDHDLESWTRKATGEAEKRMPQPKLEHKRLYLLESWMNSTAAIAAKPPTQMLTRSVEVDWVLIMNTGTEGMGFLWLDTAAHGEDAGIPDVEHWEEPNLPHAFGIGFDALDPPNRDPFRGSGNVYDRPQHEVSLHWDGREIVKRLTERDFRDEEPHHVRATLDFVTGGAEIALLIDDDPVFERYFIPSMTAYAGRPVFGARNADTAGDVMLDDLTIACRERIDAPAPPVAVVALDHELNDAAHPRHEALAAFPEDTDGFGRIICTLRLDKPETRFDPWDRTANVCVYDEGGARYEIVRYITPYHRGHVWQVDVSDFRPLLRGTRKIVQECSTQGEGWIVTVAFDFYPGPAKRYATQVIPLWSGAPEIGNPDKPVSDFYVPRTIKLDDAAQFAKVRLGVTGHGMSPNSNNAGEFMPLGRTLRVNDQSFYNVLWKTDNYLNPCRPQGGTWKYDRAGWGPGDVVRPWEVDISNLLKDASELRFEYILDPYVNENRGKTWAPTHVTEAQLILYQSVAGQSHHTRTGAGE